jgi:hypothetical protein
LKGRSPFKHHSFPLSFQGEGDKKERGIKGVRLINNLGR